jgi:glucan phosphoethanolaminetransferase (alkaline phosphatase superfamily)
MEAAWRSSGGEALPSAYEDNLIAVLQQVAVLLSSLSGRIVITSDHGELLGEDRCYGHPRGRKNPLLTTVPWLVIEKQVDSERPVADVTPAESDGTPSQKTDQTTEEEIVDKLRALGYYD